MSVISKVGLASGRRISVGLLVLTTLTMGSAGAYPIPNPKNENHVLGKVAGVNFITDKPYQCKIAMHVSKGLEMFGKDAVPADGHICDAALLAHYFDSNVGLNWSLSFDGWGLHYRSLWMAGDY